MFTAHFLGTLQKSLTWLGMKHVQSIPLPHHISRYSPDIVRTGARVMLCNNNANTVESFCTVSGTWLTSEPTNLAPVDLMHEPRMAADDNFICLIERFTGHVVVKCCVGWGTVKLPVHAGQPVAVAVHGQLAAVCCTASGKQRVVVICLQSKSVEHCFKVHIPGQPDAMKFDPTGTTILMTCGDTVYECDMDGVCVRTFGDMFLAPGHLDLNFDFQRNILVSDMTSRRVVIFDRFGNFKDASGSGLVHPTAVCAHHQYVHILDTGNSSICIYEIL